MAKFDPTQYDCTDSGNLSRLEEVKALFTNAETFVHKFCTGNQVAGVTARQTLRQLSKHCSLLLRTIQVRSIERNALRKAEKLAKKAEKLAIKNVEIIDEGVVDEVSDELVVTDENVAEQ